MSSRRTNLLLSVIILLSLVMQPLGAVAAVPAVAAPGNVGDPGAHPGPGFLFRATVTLDSVRNLARLERTGVLVLRALDGEQATLVLADGDQLTELARLGFKPRGADELRLLLSTQGPERRWLAESLTPVLAQADAIVAQKAAAGVTGAAAAPDVTAMVASLHAALSTLTPEQIAGAASSISVDDDADGLTNTEEAWWCTNPLNPNSDGDANGYADGQEVAALLNFTLSRTVRWNYGPPFGPPAAWPNFNNRDGTGLNVCNDGDYDTIPDYAEAYMVGTRVGTGDSENTDGDKFDDGQELFGTTFCPGGTTSCAWGNYPRTQDYSFITSGMPSWIRPPGDSPFVAAYPVIDFLVDPATVKVTAKEIRTIERTITQGEEISTGFAETVGASTTVGTVDTNTHSTWQENSTTEGGIEPAGVASAGSGGLGTDASALAGNISDSSLERAIPPVPEHPLSADDVNMIEVALDANVASSAQPLTGYEPYQVDGLNGDGDYALLSLASYPSIRPTDVEMIVPNLLMAVAHRQAGRWSISVQGMPGYKDGIRSLPDTILSETGKAVFLTETARQPTYNVRGFPWKIGTSWRYNQGPHGSENAWDFGTPTANVAADVYTAEPGIVVSSKETCIAIRRPGDGLLLWYQHIDSEAVKDFPISTEVSYAQQLGPTTTTNGCGGTSSGHHIHFFLNAPTQSPPPPTWASFDPQGSTLNGWKIVGEKLVKNGVEKLPNEADKISHDGNEQGDKLACRQQPFKSTEPNQSTPKVSTGNGFVAFFERLGRKVQSWFGLGGGASRIASIDTFVTGATGTPLNYSDFRSDQQCGGSPSPSAGTATGGGGSGVTLNDDGGGSFSSLRVWSQTQTTGEGWSTSHSELRSETNYREITRSSTNTLVSSEAWSTATTTDPTDAGQLTFNYNLYNTGSDAAVSLTGVRINVLIGDLPVITWNAPDRSDILPGQAKGPFGSDPLTLTLEQLAAIDNGAPIRVILADYGYDDNLYDANAWGRSVLFHVDDGPGDGDDTGDTYLITTNLVQGETYQDTLARYFEVTTFQGAPGDERNGTITGIRTPEFAGDGEITGWNDHPVNDHAWWELSISLGGETDGVSHFRDMPAKAKTDVYLRYVLDTDADGFSDRAELDAGSDPNDPDIHPRPLVTVAQHTTVSGTNASVQVTLQNDGNLDASSVELWAIAPDDSITITDNLVGGGGRVRAGRQVVLGSRIGKPDLTAWTTSTAKPYPDGQFEGASPKTFKFQALDSGNVGSGTLRVKWSNDNGATWQPTPLALGSGYTAWTPLTLSDGLTIAFSGGYITTGETFTFATALPIDTFAYTINRTPYTPPLIIASYNDPEGNHKFVSDVELPDIQADLAPYLGDMRYGFQLDVMAATPFAAGANTAHLVFNNPAAQAISGANLYVEFATPDGTVAKEYVLANQALLPGPNVITLAWDTADFNPAFDPTADYHILVFAADRQGTIFENTVKGMDQVGKDRLPAAVLPGEDWNFGTAQQGTLLRHTMAVANTGYRDMLTFVAASDPAIGLSDQGSRTVAAGDVTQYELALNTADLAVGAYHQIITIRTSDPDARERTVHVVGTVTAAAADTPVGAMQRPLDWSATVSGTQGQWVEFTHTLGPEPSSLHPVRVYSQDYLTPKGVGKYATSFGAGTAPYDMFGDGRDGVMPSSGNLDRDTGVGVGIVNSGTIGTYSINVTDAYAGWRINIGDVVLIHQTQGTGAGCWELNKAVSDYTGGTAAIQVTKPLQCNYASGGNNHAQIQRVPQYTLCPISGTVTPLSGWNGTWGGILAVMCRDSMTITGAINASGAGYRGGQTGTLIDQSWSYAGEGLAAPSIKQRTANGNGGGGGKHKIGRTGGGGGGGSLYVGADGWQTSEGNDNGYGGSSVGNPELTIAVLGGGGGGGGHSDGPEVGGVGGNGGGLILLHTGQLSVPGLLVANGANGTNAAAGQFGDAGGGGGGAGGIIRVVARIADIGSSRVQVGGGEGGISPGVGGRGGGGSVGRIRVEYCESFTGTTNPPASTQKLNCYIADQATDPTHGILNLPASGVNTYQVQYGRRFVFTVSEGQVKQLRVPQSALASALLDVLVSEAGTGSFTIKLDMGNDSADQWDYEYTGNVNGSIELNDLTLTAAFNRYWSSQGGPLGGTTDVPVEVWVSKAANVLLTDLKVTPTGSKLRHLRLLVQPQGYDNIQIDFTVSGASGPLTVGVDVGDDGMVDWAYSGTPAYPATLTTGNLATAVNAHLAGQTGEVDVPIRFYLAPFATLNLTGFTAVPAGATDAGLSNADLTFDTATPSEGDVVTVMAIVHNAESLDTGPLAVSFYATPASGIETRIGSAFVANVPAAGTATVPLQWNTLGFTGDVPVRVVVDPYNRLTEANETNNGATATLPIKTRPDLRVTDIAVTDTGPVVGQAVTVTLTLHNAGQTAAPASVLALYDDHPDHSRVLICEDGEGTPANASRTVTCQWIPTAPGQHRLFAQVDRDQAVNESNETNNAAWRDVYVGFAGPILLDSGGGDAYDPTYSPESGYGYVDEGTPDITFSCGATGSPDDTLRLDPDGHLVYRFEHFQPGHFYHLDIVLRECDGAGRQQTISIDGNRIEGPVDLLDGATHSFSILLDPAFYADRAITVAIDAPGIDGAVVSQVNVHDIDYRYADAGGSNDPAYSAATGYGWLDGVKNTGYGTLPYQSVRVNQSGNTLRYRFDRLLPGAKYWLRFTFYQSSGGARVQEVEVDGVWTGLEVNTGNYQPHRETIEVPAGAYQADGSIVVGIRRTNASTGAFVNEISLEERTLPGQVTQNLTLHATTPNWVSFNIKPEVRPALYCSGVTATAAFTSVGGNVLLAGAAAPVNSIIEAFTPAGVKVGCFKAHTAGKYGYMRVYGAEGTTPGMQPGEPIQFKVNGIASQPAPYPVIWQNDRLTHVVNLDAPDVIPVETFLDPIAGQVVKLQSETGTYLPPPADPRFNTTTTVVPGQGYLLYISANTPLPVSGERVPADTPLALHAGWNWLGYLPTCELPIQTVLADIAGQYDLLNGETGTYRPPPADPAFNNFNTMAPGKGYMIHMTAAATLIYPANQCGGALRAREEAAPAFTCPAVPTSRFTHFYGHVTPAEDAPPGAVILAYSPRGEVVGCEEVGEDGLYPYLRVYGAEDAQPGMQPAEAVHFTVNGRLVLPSVAAIWQNDWNVHPLDLTFDGVQYQYLPLIVR